MKGVVTALLVAAVVLVQAAVVNRLPLPWGVGPDLVVLAVAAVALRTGPAGAAATGFCAGLAVDLLPPADHEAGRYALLYCLAGYLVSRYGWVEGRGRARVYGTAAVAALGTAAGFALLGTVLGDPRVSLAAAAFAVPVSALETVVVGPLVLAPMGRILRAVSPDAYVGAYPDLPAPVRSGGGIGGWRG
ncbi:rod shape-determining protein MreD [Nocardiopsis baichengensis]|uniref:rod shape-determining protein MreD n=1 Tax=Nocardiopsis baichengensis TaxID=280240 RepID=UPI00034A7194|nr:rod shape-determining protein MreD [Nocardiopsis baichengensis]